MDNTKQLGAKKIAQLEKQPIIDTVLLKSEEGDDVLPIWIGSAEGLAIELQLKGGKFERPLTHDLLASMLGVRRASITLAAGALHRAGLIDHAHKNIAIIDPAGLEAAACECYAVVKGHFARLLA